MPIPRTDTAGHAYYDGPFRNHMFKDFELRVDAMTRQGSNGGIYILTEFQEKGFPLKGFEVQVNNSHTDRVKTGSLFYTSSTRALHWQKTMSGSPRRSSSRARTSGCW